MSCFIYFGKTVVPIGHGNSFWLVLESYGKVMENDFPERVVTLAYLIPTFCGHLKKVLNGLSSRQKSASSIGMKKL